MNAKLNTGLRRPAGRGRRVDGNAGCAGGGAGARARHARRSAQRCVGPQDPRRGCPAAASASVRAASSSRCTIASRAANALWSTTAATVVDRALFVPGTGFGQTTIRKESAQAGADQHPGRRRRSAVHISTPRRATRAPAESPCQCCAARLAPAAWSQRTMAQAKSAVILLSGGLDSMVSAGLAREQGFTLYALTIDYNQRHRREIEAASRIARALGVQRHVVLPLDLSRFGGSALTSDKIAVPKEGVGDGHPGHLRPGAQPGVPVADARDGRGERRARHLHRRQRARLFGLSRLPAGIHRQLRRDRAARDQGGRRGRTVHDPRAAAVPGQGGHRARGGAAGVRSGDELVVLRPDARRRGVRGLRSAAACGARASPMPGWRTARSTRRARRRYNDKNGRKHDRRSEKTASGLCLVHAGRAGAGLHAQLHRPADPLDPGQRHQGRSRAEGRPARFSLRDRLRDLLRAVRCAAGAAGRRLAPRCVC